MNKKVYIGGELFTEADVIQRLREGKDAKDLGYRVYNPIANDEINDKSDNPTSEDIFMQDTTEVLTSDFITAPIDNEDPGLMMELGMALAGNLFMEALDEMEEELSQEALEIVKKYNPFKRVEVLTIASDIRKETAGEYDSIHVPKGYNQYVIGGLESLGNGRFYNGWLEVERFLKNRKGLESE